MSKTGKKTLTAVLAFALAAQGMIGEAALNGVSAAEQPVAVIHDSGEPVEFALDAGVYEVNAGDVFKLKIKATDIKESFCAVNAYLEVNTDAFTVLSVTPGDTDDPDNENTDIFQNTTVSNYASGRNAETVAFVYSDLAGLSEDTVLVTVELKVNDDAEAGSYAAPFDIRDGGSDAVSLVPSGYGQDIKSLISEFRGALIKVGEGSEETVMPDFAEEYTEEDNNEDENNVNHATVREYINEET
ncbi:MAG: hypothetical protein ILP22_01870, partial [Oscillospiraceae bacterium]|nr:hypothetical protein [Oscillospiraceae bacterium]